MLLPLKCWISVGRVPDNELPLTRKCSSLGSEKNNSLGMEPTSQFPLKLSTSSKDNFPMSEGMEPESSLKLKDRRTSDRNNASSVGIGPLSALCSIGNHGHVSLSGS